MFAYIYILFERGQGENNDKFVQNYIKGCFCVSFKISFWIDNVHWAFKRWKYKFIYITLNKRSQQQRQWTLSGLRVDTRLRVLLSKQKWAHFFYNIFFPLSSLSCSQKQHLTNTTRLNKTKNGRCSSDLKIIDILRSNLRCELLI